MLHISHCFPIRSPRKVVVFIILGYLIISIRQVAMLHSLLICLEESNPSKVDTLLQVKDRLFDARPFSINLPSDNPSLRAMNEDHIFDAANFGLTSEKLRGFNQIAR